MDRLSQNNPLLGLMLILVSLLPLLYFHSLYTPASLPRYALIACVAGFGVLFYAISIWKQQRYFLWHPVQILVLLFFLLASLSSLWSIDKSNNLIEILQLSSFAILFFLATQVSSIKHITWICTMAVASAGIAALIGIMQNYGFNPMQYSNPVMASTFIFKNHAALYFDLIVPVSFFIILISNNKIIKWLAAIAFGLCVGFLIESRTRGSWVAITAVVVLLLVLWTLHKQTRENINSKIKENRTYLIAALLVASTAFVPQGENDIAWERKPIAGQKLDQSAFDRLLFYRNSLGIIKENPILGTGLGTFWKAFRPYMNYPYIIQRSNEHIYLIRAHNDILQTFTELGLVGGILSLAIYSFILFIGIQIILNKKSDSGKSLLTIGLLLAFTASLIHSLVDFPLHKPSSAALFWIWAGFITALHLSDKEERKSYRIKIFFSPILFATSIIYLSLSAMFYTAYIKDSYYLHLAENHLTAGNCPAALNNIEKAVNSFGLYFITHIIRVRIHVKCNKNPQALFYVLNEELQYDRSNILARLKRADLYRLSGYLDKADQDYKVVVQILPHRVSGKIGVASVLVAKGQNEEAKKYLKTILHEHPDNKYAIRLLRDINDTIKAN